MADSRVSDGQVAPPEDAATLEWLLNCVNESLDYMDRRASNALTAAGGLELASSCVADDQDLAMHELNSASELLAAPTGPIPLLPAELAWYYPDEAEQARQLESELNADELQSKREAKALLQTVAPEEESLRGWATLWRRKAGSTMRRLEPYRRMRLDLIRRVTELRRAERPGGPSIAKVGDSMGGGLKGEEFSRLYARACCALNWASGMIEMARNSGSDSEWDDVYARFAWREADEWRANENTTLVEEVKRADWWLTKCDAQIGKVRGDNWHEAAASVERELGNVLWSAKGREPLDCAAEPEEGPDFESWLARWSETCKELLEFEFDLSKAREALDKEYNYATDPKRQADRIAEHVLATIRNENNAPIADRGKPANLTEWATLPEFLDRMELRAHEAAVSKRLERWRKTHDGDFREVQNPRRNEPRYLYRVAAVMPLVQDLLSD